MIVKTQDLTDIDANWAVASILKQPADLLVWKDGEPILICSRAGIQETLRCDFCTDWSLAGNLIDRLGIRVEPEAFGSHGFSSWRSDVPKGPTSKHGYLWMHAPTAQKAVALAFIAFHLGAQVEVPEQRDATVGIEAPSLEVTIERMKCDVLDLIASGTVPQNIGGFSELHGHVDANCLGRLCEDEVFNALMDRFGGHDEKQGMSQGLIDYINAAQDAVDAWLKAGRPTS